MKFKIAIQGYLVLTRQHLLLSCLKLSKTPVIRVTVYDCDIYCFLSHKNTPTRVLKTT